MVQPKLVKELCSLGCKELFYQLVVIFSISEYRKFLQIQEEGRLQWQETKAEAQRLQMELDKCSKERADLETKLFHARRLLELEAKSRRAVESEHEALERKLSQVYDFLKEDCLINDETRHKYAFLNLSSRKRKSKSMGHGNDINSTGSFLSDLSVTQSEEDFLDDEKKQFKRHRPSTTGLNVSSRRSTRKSLAAGRQSRSKFYILSDFKVILIIKI